MRNAACERERGEGRRSLDLFLPERSGNQSLTDRSESQLSAERNEHSVARKRCPTSPIPFQDGREDNVGTCHPSAARALRQRRDVEAGIVSQDARAINVSEDPSGGTRAEQESGRGGKLSEGVAGRTRGTAIRTKYKCREGGEEVF